MRYLLLSLTLLLTGLVPTQASHSESEGIDVKEIVLGHMADAYEWHITTIGGKHISIPLPVIVRSERTGEWHTFSSSHIEEAAEEGQDYMGFYFNEEKNGKIYERLDDGTTVRPWDLSITKSVVQIWIVVFVMLAIFLSCARWYKKHDAREEAPRGFAGVMEMMITMVEDDIIKECIGKEYKRYSPYLLTAFFFIFVNNLMGIVPFFPGGANITGNIAVTFVLAMCTFLAVNLFGNKHYYKDIFWPDVPLFLKVIPLMPLIEIIGLFTKPFSLMIRLFANILAGHVMLLGVVAVVFLTAKLGFAMNAGLSAISVLFGVFLDILELLVAFLQAYVFTMLSAVFIGLSRQGD